MLFYASNLIVNIVINGVTCQFLDLVSTNDDLTLVNGIVHYKTFCSSLHI